jgi:hypothetical protein
VERYYPGDARVLKIPDASSSKNLVCSEPEFIRVEFNLSWRNQAWLLQKLLPAIPNFPLFCRTSLNGSAREIRQYNIRMGHGKSSFHRGSCEGLRASGLDLRAKAVVGVDQSGAPGSTLLSRELVTVLPPPVGGLSRTLSGNQIGGREPSGCFGGSARSIGGLANSALIAVSDFVR